MQESETGHYHTPLIIINSKWIKSLNVTPETIIVVGESLGEIFFIFILSMFS